MLTVPQDNLLRNFPAAHTTTADALDAKFADANPTNFVPVLRATTTDPDLGNGGTIEGKYVTVLDMVIAWGSWSFGSSPDVGSGTYYIELPIPLKFGNSKSMYSSGFPGRGMILGTAFAISTRPKLATCQIRLIASLPQPSQLQFNSADSSGSSIFAAWSHDTPFSWSPGTQANWNACYLRDEL